MSLDTNCLNELVTQEQHRYLLKKKTNQIQKCNNWSNIKRKATIETKRRARAENVILLNELTSSRTLNKNNKYTLQRTAMLIASEGRRSKVILSVGSSVCRTGGIQFRMLYIKTKQFHHQNQYLRQIEFSTICFLNSFVYPNKFYLEKSTNIMIEGASESTCYYVSFQIMLTS